MVLRLANCELVRPRLLGLLLSSILVAAPAAAQDNDEDSPFRPGLVATYTADGKSVQRIDELVAFDWQDAAPDPRLAAQPFSTIWRGRLWRSEERRVGK